MDHRRPNQRGNQLIKFCKSNNLFISNGRLNSDMSGKATTSDGSLIDYMIASPVLLCKVENFLVHDFDAIFSDKHCRVSWSIKCINQPHNLNKITDTSNVISIKKTHRNMWASDKAIDFTKQLKVNDINNIKNKLDNHETHIDCILSDVQTLFKNAADNVLGEEYEYEIDISRKYKPIKFDRQTLNLRNRYCNARKTKTGVSDASKAYKKAVAKAKAINRKHLIKKLTKSWKKNAKYYWATLRERNSNLPRNSNMLSIEKNFKGFKELAGNESRGEYTCDLNEKGENLCVDKTTEEVADMILNCQFTVDEKKI